MSNKDSFDYYEAVMSVNGKIPSHAREILGDLKKYSKLLSYVPESRRFKLKGFLSGLYELSDYTGSRYSELKQGISLLDLSDSDTRRYSRLSESDIDTQAKAIYHGVKASAGRASVSNIVPYGSAPKYRQVSGLWESDRTGSEKRIDSDLLKDAENMRRYKYELGEVLKGNDYIDIFTDRYIAHYEEKIFGMNVSQKFLRGEFGYAEFIKSQLVDIYTEIADDVDRGVKGRDFIKYDYAMNLKKAAAYISRCMVNTYGFNEKMEKYQLEDVTKEMFAVMKEAKRDGEKIYLDYFLLSPEYGKYVISFYDLVKSGGKYDIKIKYPFNKYPQYYFDGMVIDYDDTGNIVFGVIGKAIRLDETVLHTGAGVYNFSTAVINAIKADEAKIGKLMDAVETELSWIGSKFDDPRDYEAIELGYEYYNKI